MDQHSSDATARLDQEFGRILEDSLNEIFIFDAATLKFVQVNRGARENLGYSMEELRNLSPVDLKPEYTHDTFEKRITTLREGQEQTLRFSTRHRRKDGSDYNIDIHLQLASFHDKPSFIAIAVDTTDQILAEEEKREREARLSAILDTAAEAIITINERGICESINSTAEAMFGYPAEEVIGKNVSMLMPSPDQEKHDGYLANYMRTGKKQIIGIGREVVGLRKSGEEFPIHLAVSEVQLEHRRLFTGFIQDITERKEAERRLVQSERLAVLGEAMARLAHESRNSLQRIQIAVETARLHCDDKTPLAAQLDAIEKSSDGLDALLDEVKNYAAPLNLEKERASLVGIWREAWQATLPLRSERIVDLEEKINEELNEEFSEGGIYCYVDHFRFGQVFRNLFENSLSACQDPAQLKISVSETHTTLGKLWRLQFSDNGPGLNEEQAQRIFEPFFTTKAKGTGLGMAIAHRIVEAHGGTISVGKVDRRGAEFIIELPQ